MKVKQLEEQTLLLNEEEVEKEKIYYEVFFVVLPLFSGYGCLFALQRKLKEQYGIADNNSDLSHYYGVAVSLVYLGNLFLRLGHNIIFCWLTPRLRVVRILDFFVFV